MREELGGEQQRIGEVVSDVEQRLTGVRNTLQETAKSVGEVSGTAEEAARTVHDALR